MQNQDLSLKLANKRRQLPPPHPHIRTWNFFFQIISFCKDFFFFNGNCSKSIYIILQPINVPLFLTMKMKWIPEPILMLLERLKLSSIDFQVQLLFKIFEQTILIKLQITRKRTSHSCLQAYNIKQYKRKICIWWPIEACLYLM